MIKFAWCSTCDMRLFKKLLIPVFLSLCFISCLCDKPDCPGLNDSDFQNIPYQAGDTIYYRSNLNNEGYYSVGTREVEKKDYEPYGFFQCPDYCNSRIYVGLLSSVFMDIDIDYIRSAESLLFTYRFGFSDSLMLSKSNAGLPVVINGIPYDEVYTYTTRSPNFPNWQYLISKSKGILQIKNLNNNEVFIKQ